ncbi:2-succinyl-6-hydroxy-2,4-cyclohexadiene-1-carboxylate synthase [Bacillus piscicola]|uniref:2-succinyl-6-hydroxy-2, 4-cyclohexadiene-1-carboxylate synthase n=1 Tax=Bacillus piscicola TaxID=1632684 RepID=UPI001F0906E8|nr:2-succinyl-6-hydroxy-2,4-cyclohexadiene-1-carboxylate synthase [Bacillus piscicola]
MRRRIRGVEYHIQLAGEGEPLVLLHGFTGNRETWDFLVPYLEQHFQLIMVDIIGHGESSVPADFHRYTAEETVADLVSLLKELTITDAHWLGYSMGGRLALSLASLYPECVRSLLLESASPGLRSSSARVERQNQDKRLADRILAKGVPAFVNQWENIPLFATQKQLPYAEQRKIREQRLKNSALGLANSLLGMGTGSQPSWWDQLPDLHFPVLLLTGEWDDKFNNIASEMKKALPAAEWHIVPKTGHAVHVEDQEMFATIVSEFLFRNKRRT